MLTHLLNPSDHSLATAADVVVGLTFYESYGDADISDIFEILWWAMMLWCYDADVVIGLTFDES